MSLVLTWQCLCGSVSGPTRRPKLVYNKCGGCCSTFIPRMLFQDQGSLSPDARCVGWWWLTGGNWPWAKGTAFPKITHLLWGHIHPMTGQHRGTKAWFFWINLRHLWWDISTWEFSVGLAEANVPSISLPPLPSAQSCCHNSFRNIALERYPDKFSAKGPSS